MIQGDGIPDSGSLSGPENNYIEFVFFLGVLTVPTGT
jgi:hypothetical protein